MKKIPAVVLAVIAAILVFPIWLNRHDASIRAEAAQRAVDSRNDSVASALRREAADSQKAFSRERDSTGREIRYLKRRVAESEAQPASTGTPEASVSATLPDLRDSLIDVLTVGRQQDSLQLLFWRAQVTARDSLIGALQASRNAWKQRSETRFFCVAGPSATVGWNGRSALGLGATCGIRL